MTASPETAIPITILTGFLGAGKTTLLNRILNGNHGLRVAVLVNDFGAINIDAALVVGVKDNVLSLTNGCVCCTIRDDLVETVVETINRPEAPEYIILEASGVADPSGIAMTFIDKTLRDRIRLDSVACVIDADQVFAHPEYPAVEQLQLRQIAFSDMLILNKVDLAGAAKVRRVREWINGSFKRLRIVETDFCEVPLEILLSVGRFDPARSAFEAQHACMDPHCADASHSHDHWEHALGHHVDHGKTFSTWSFETDQPLSLQAVREAAAKLPGSVYRCKGVIHSIDSPEQPAVLQVVGRRVDISAQEAWGERGRRTQIVAIGAANDLDVEFLKEAFSSCVAL